MLKKIMIPVAAFAVFTTTASAFSGDILSRINVDLTDDQVATFEEAAALKESGADRSEVKSFLEESGIDEALLKEVRTAAKEVKKETREAVKVAVESNDYNAFLAVAPEKLTEAVTSQADFDLYVEAAALKESGDKEGAQAIYTELGIEKMGKKGGHGERGNKGDRTE